MHLKYCSLITKLLRPTHHHKSLLIKQYLLKVYIGQAYCMLRSEVSQQVEEVYPERGPY